MCSASVACHTLADTGRDSPSGVCPGINSPTDVETSSFSERVHPPAIIAITRTTAIPAATRYLTRLDVIGSPTVYLWQLMHNSPGVMVFNESSSVTEPCG